MQIRGRRRGPFDSTAWKEAPALVVILPYHGDRIPSLVRPEVRDFLVVRIKFVEVQCLGRTSAVSFIRMFHRFVGRFCRVGTCRISMSFDSQASRKSMTRARHLEKAHQEVERESVVVQTSGTSPLPHLFWRTKRGKGFVNEANCCQCHLYPTAKRGGCGQWVTNSGDQGEATGRHNVQGTWTRVSMSGQSPSDPDLYGAHLP